MNASRFVHSAFMALVVGDSITSPSSVAEHVSEFNQAQISIVRSFFDLGKSESERMIREAFQTGSLPGELVSGVAEHSRAEIGLLLSSYRGFVNRTSDVGKALDMVSLLDRLLSHEDFDPAKDANEPSEAQRVYDILVNARFFFLADEVASRYSDQIRRFPYSVESVEPLPARFPYYEVVGGKALKARALQLQEGEWLVASVSPGCSFSVEAMRFIEYHFDTLEPMLPENTAWIATHQLTYLLPHVERFNREHQHMEIRVSADDRRWPDLMALDITPVFYRVKDGQIVDRSAGWAGPEPQENFIKFLQGFSGQSDHQAGHGSRHP